MTALRNPTGETTYRPDRARAKTPVDTENPQTGKQKDKCPVEKKSEGQTTKISFPALLPPVEL